MSIPTTPHSGQPHAMATLTTSSLFVRLQAAWRQLALRGDVDDLILELLGRFSLEKIYADSDKHAYGQLVLILLAQLSVIFDIQRLSLPSENQPAARYLPYLVNWEIALRTVESMLQVVVESRESLWDAQSMLKEYLARFLLSAIRILSLHPKASASDRRERFARIHRSLEVVCDNYPDSRSFFLLVSKEIATALCMDQDSISLPATLKYDLPSLATKLYPLPNCLSPQRIAEVVPENSAPNDWLSQFYALYDISQFVVGAAIQHAVNEGSNDTELTKASAQIRDAVLKAVDRLQVPPHLHRPGMLAVFSETYSTILSDTPNIAQGGALDRINIDIRIEALSSLCTRLLDRQTNYRANDRELIQNISAITRRLSRLDDTSSWGYRTTAPRLYVINCKRSHLAGASQVRELLNIKVNTNSEESSIISLPQGSQCPFCGETVTLIHEITLARHAWELLHPLQSSVDSVDTERHQPTQFRLLPVMFRNSLSSQSPRHQSLAALDEANISNFIHPANRPRAFSDNQESLVAISEQPFSADSVRFGHLIPTPGRKEPSTRGAPVAAFPFDQFTSSSSTSPPVSEKSKSKWKSKLSLPKKDMKKDHKGSGDTSSLSSSTVESERVEVISLKSMTNTSTSSRSKSSRSINVSLSQNSADVVFWTQLTLSVWDVSTSRPTVRQSIPTEGSCVIAAVSKDFLAYIVGSRDRTLTLRIKSSRQQSSPVVEYRMQSSPWCKTIAISPSGNYVAIGFEDSTVRIYDAVGSESPREDQLHSQKHKDSQGSSPVDTLAFSNDGLVLLASVRCRNGVIQLFSWKFPFREFEEMSTCRYHVPMHESEDCGVTSAIFQSTVGGEGIICITTWTQSGTPVLIQSKGGYRCEIKRQGSSNHHSKLGTRIHNAGFSPSGKELALINDKGHAYLVSNLDSAPIDIRRISTSKELTAKTDSYSMAYVTIPDEGEAIVLAWVDASKATAYVKTIHVMSRGDPLLSPRPTIFRPTSPGLVSPASQMTFSELHGDAKKHRLLVELAAFDENSV